MSLENLPASRAGIEAEVVPASGGHQATPDLDGAFSPYRLANQYLRGRYLIAIGAGLILAVAMAIAGYFSTGPLYRSEALIRISFEVPTLIKGDQEYRSMDAFMAFMASQQEMLKSHRILSAAVKDPMWQENGFENVATMPIDGFASDLKVDYRGGEHLKVVYDSSDPLFASTAVQTIVKAYVDAYNSMDKKSASEKTSVLESRRAQLITDLESMDVKLRDASQEFGSSNIDDFYTSAVTRLTRVESSLIDVRIALALSDGRNDDITRLTPQQIARFDPTMARYQADREHLEMELQQLRLRGYGEEHKQVIQAKQMLDLTESRIREYAMEFQGAPSVEQFRQSAAPPNLAQQGTPGLAGKSTDELKAIEANLMALSESVKLQVTTLASQKLKLESMRSEQAKLKDELAMVTEQLTKMRLESGISGRLSVLSNGETPLLPFRDRRLYIAAAGGATGLFLPAAGIIAFGLVSRRYRYSVDAADDLAGEIPLLGILPQLPARLTDPESAADAAQCLHQIRVMLQVQNPTHSSVAYLLTSSCPGEGKTSLCAALALSFAAAGARTLIIDADLIGQRLTRGYRLDDKPGFREAMSHNAKAVKYYPSGVERLWIMPAGLSDGRDACAVASKSLKKLMATAREHFDVILVDSGPILGSLEALVASQHVDGVVLTISREQQKPLVDRAIRQLRSVKARIAGMVFNKAEQADFKRSVGATSLRSIPRNPESGPLVRAGVTSTSGFGALVDSVQTYMPAGQA